MCFVVAESGSGIELQQVLSMAGRDAPTWFRSIKIATRTTVLLIVNGTHGERGVRAQGHVAAAIEYDFEVLCLILNWMEA